MAKNKREKIELQEYLNHLNGLFENTQIDLRQFHILHYIAFENSKHHKSLRIPVRVPLFRISLDTNYSIQNIRTIIKKLILKGLLKKYTINKYTTYKEKKYFRLQTYYQLMPDRGHNDIKE